MPESSSTQRGCRFPLPPPCQWPTCDPRRQARVHQYQLAERFGEKTTQISVNSRNLFFQRGLYVITKLRIVCDMLGEFWAHIAFFWMGRNQ